jgi:hypothetical protein
MLQEQFLRTYAQRAQGVSAETEALKAQRAEAHRTLLTARRKLGHIQQRLQEEAGRKEASELFLFVLAGPLCFKISRDKKDLKKGWGCEDAVCCSFLPPACLSGLASAMHAT